MRAGFFRFGHNRGIAELSAVWILLPAALWALPPVTQNLAIALDGSDVSFSSTGGGGIFVVDSWRDRALAVGGAQHLRPYSTTAKPRYLPDVTMPNQRRHNLVSWDGTANQCMWLDTDTYFDKFRNLDIELYTWFIVFKCNRVDATLGLLQTHFYGYLHGSLLAPGGVARSFYQDTNDDARLDTAGIQPGKWYILTCVLNGGGTARNGFLANTLTQFVMTEDGEHMTPVSLSAGINFVMYHYATVVGARILRNGTAPQSTTSFDGDMAEVLIYTDCLSTTDREAVESYLYAKYFKTDLGFQLMAR